MIFVSHGHNFQFGTLFNRIENPESIESKFPGSDGIRSKLLLPARFRFGLRFQVTDDSCDDDSLIGDFEECDVFLCAHRDRDLILHSPIVAGKPTTLKRPLEAVRIGTDIGVAEKFLNSANIVAAFQ